MCTKPIEGNLTKVRIGGYNNLNEAPAVMKVLRKTGSKIFCSSRYTTEAAAYWYINQMPILPTLRLNQQKAN